MHLIHLTHGLHGAFTLLNALAEGAPQTSYKTKYNTVKRQFKHHLLFNVSLSNNAAKVW